MDETYRDGFIYKSRYSMYIKGSCGIVVPFNFDLQKHSYLTLFPHQNLLFFLGETLMRFSATIIVYPKKICCKLYNCYDLRLESGGYPEMVILAYLFQAQLLEYLDSL